MSHEPFLPAEEGGPSYTGPGADSRDPQPISELMQDSFDALSPAGSESARSRREAAFQRLVSVVLELADPDTVTAAQQELLEAQLQEHGITPSWKR